MPLEIIEVLECCQAVNIMGVISVRIKFCSPVKSSLNKLELFLSQGGKFRGK